MFVGNKEQQECDHHFVHMGETYHSCIKCHLSEEEAKKDNFLIMLQELTYDRQTRKWLGSILADVLSDNYLLQHKD